MDANTLISIASASRYLTATDCGDGLPLTIVRVTVESLKGDRGERERGVVWFEEEERGLVLNVTLSVMLREMFGVELGAWEGKRPSVAWTCPSTTSTGGPRLKAGHRLTRWIGTPERWRPPGFRSAARTWSGACWVTNDAASRDSVVHLRVRFSVHYPEAIPRPGSCTGRGRLAVEAVQNRPADRSLPSRGVWCGPVLRSGEDSRGGPGARRNMITPAGGA